MRVFRVGSETGGSEAGEALAFAHTALNNVFFFDPSLGSYFKDLDFFVLALRVSGRTKDFKSEGPGLLKKSRGHRFYTIDLVIPESKWKGASFNDLRQYVIDGVTECFDLCLEKAQRDGCIVNEEKLRSDFEAGIKKILCANSNDSIFNKSKGAEILKAMEVESDRLGLNLGKQELLAKMQKGIFTLG